VDDRGAKPSARPGGAAPGLNSAVFRLLARGSSLGDVAEQMSGRRQPGVSVDDLRRVLIHARTVVREDALLPPVEAAFFGRVLTPPAGARQGAPGAEVSQRHREALRALALELIESHLAVEPAPREPRDAGQVAVRSAALQYAEALLRQEEVLDDLEQAANDASSVHSSLTGTDRTRIEEFILYRRGRRLDALLDSWESCVRSVERDDQTLMHEEYHNWLDVRDALNAALTLLSPAARPPLASPLGALDERFLQATREVSTSVLPQRPWRSQAWWWYRLPRRPGPSFRARLQHVAPAAAEEALTPTDDRVSE
jgi:hypothetical protein